MQGEPHGAYFGIVDEARLHHVPADSALQRAKQKDAAELPRERAVQFFLHEEINVGKKKDNPDQAREQPVDVFPPEDALETFERHAEVDLTEFRRLAVLREQRFPIGLRKRRQHADERLPLHDGKAGASKAGDAADEHDEKCKRGASKQPGGNLTAFASSHWPNACMARSCCQPTTSTAPTAASF